MAYRDYANNYAFIVDASGKGNYTTIAAAITDASSGDNIYIAAGTYTEDLTLKAGVNLFGDGQSEKGPITKIVGKLTADYSGTVNLNNLTFETNGDYYLEMISASTPELYLFGCSGLCTDNDGINFATDSSYLQLTDCFADTQNSSFAHIVKSGSSSIVLVRCRFFSVGGYGAPSTISEGAVLAYSCYFAHPFSVSGSGLVRFYFTIVSTGSGAVGLALAGSSSLSRILFCRFITGTASSITIDSGVTLTLMGAYISSSNAAAMSGTGTLNYADVYFSGSSSNVTVSTQTQFADSLDRDFSGSVTISSQSANDVPYFGSGGLISGLTLSDGELVIGATGGAPAAAAITSTGSTIDITAGTNTINLETAASIPDTFDTDGSSATPALGVIQMAGGTNITTSGATNVVTYDLDTDITGLTSLVVDNLTLDGNAITSTSGSVDITPLSGESLNVSLGTTGDFIVNTDDLVVDTSAGFVGIGTASPGSALDIEVGDGVDAFAINTWITTYTDSPTDTYNMGIAGTAPRLYVTNLGGTKQESVLYGDTTSTSATIFGVAGSIDSGGTWVPGLLVGIDGHLELSNQLVTINTSGDIIPAGAGQDLGSSGVPWDSVYVGNLLATGNTLSSTDTDGDIVFDPDGTGSVSITDAADLLCSGDRAQDIGSTTNAWDNIYCDGISFDDGTNTLDDYEEGTWTPTLTFGGAAVDLTYGTQFGIYKKVGNIIEIGMDLTLTAKGSSTGAAVIAGLPFTSSAVTSTGYAGQTDFTNTASYTYIQVNNGASGATLSIQEMGSAQSIAAADDTNFVDTTGIYTNFWYSEA